MTRRRFDAKRVQWGRQLGSGGGRGFEVGEVRVGGVGGVGFGVPNRDTKPLRPPPFSKLPTPTSLHTFRVKSSLRQIVLASSRLRVNHSRQVCSRQIVRVKLSCTLRRTYPNSRLALELPLFPSFPVEFSSDFFNLLLA